MELGFTPVVEVKVSILLPPPDDCDRLTKSVPPAPRVREAAVTVVAAPASVMVRPPPLTVSVPNVWLFVPLVPPMTARFPPPRVSGLPLARMLLAGAPLAEKFNTRAPPAIVVPPV